MKPMKKNKTALEVVHEFSYLNRDRLTVAI